MKTSRHRRRRVVERVRRDKALPPEVHGKVAAPASGSQEELPDWKTTFQTAKGPEADPVMVVTLGNQVHRIKVKPGEDGQKEFQSKIRDLFNIPPGVDFEVTFRCKAPPVVGITSDTIQLEGMNSYNAATHCASVMAAQRIASNNTKGAFRRNGNEIVEGSPS
eukprot:gene22768-29936_t